MDINSALKVFLGAGLGMPDDSREFVIAAATHIAKQAQELEALTVTSEQIANLDSLKNHLHAKDFSIAALTQWDIKQSKELEQANKRIEELHSALNYMTTEFCDRDPDDDDPLPAEDQRCECLMIAMKALSDGG